MAGGESPSMKNARGKSESNYSFNFGRDLLLFLSKVTDTRKNKRQSGAGFVCVGEEGLDILVDFYFKKIS